MMRTMLHASICLYVTTLLKYRKLNQTRKVRIRQSNVKDGIPTLFHEGPEINKLQPDTCSSGKFYSNGKKHYSHKDVGLESNAGKDFSLMMHSKVDRCYGFNLE